MGRIVLHLEADPLLLDHALDRTQGHVSVDSGGFPWGATFREFAEGLVVDEGAFPDFLRPVPPEQGGYHERSEADSHTGRHGFAPTLNLSAGGPGVKPANPRNALFFSKLQFVLR